MKAFAGDELRRFLQALDGRVPRETRLVVIGGAAACLAFGSLRATLDIDTANALSIDEACEEARQETGLQVPLLFVSIFDGPYEYEGRLRRLRLKGIRNLRIWVPERHDWALMKIIRLNDKDVAHLVDVHGRTPFLRETLARRFLGEMTHVIGPQRRLALQFLAAMETLFGKSAADRLEARIRRHPHWQAFHL